MTTNILMNGALVGTTDTPKQFVENMKDKRRSGAISKQTNISYDELADDIYVNTDHGRVRRPLIVVEDGEPLLTQEHIEKLEKDQLDWDDLVDEGIIEYIDPDEEENALVALDEDDINEKTTHMELDEQAILGVSSSIVPYGEYDRGDRVNFGAKMVGQTIGHYASNFFTRTDTKANLIAYPQEPIVSTRSYPIFGFDDHPAGQNVVIALMSHEGYNIEDAVIVNESTIERGFGRSFFYRTYDTQERRYGGGQTDEITLPGKDVRGYISEDAYSHLGEDGVVLPETDVEGGDVLVGKTSPLRFLGRDDFLAGIHNRRETSLSVRNKEEGTVDKVILSETGEGNKMVKVTVREQRIPEVGDKFASRHGQKGVIGQVASEEDMPFTRQGVTPDVIMNPHSIPSRLTVGQLLEMVAGKAGALNGEIVDGSMFNGEEEDELRDQLKELGFRSDGKEVMYNGKTGEMMEAEIFVGSVYYLRLKHMVANKIHARSRGPVTLLTKQPTEGRAKDGGLRFGEMEKDCLVAHGASLLLNDRFGSDQTTMPVCTDCGLVAYHDYQDNKPVCPDCKRSTIVDVGMAYAFKLMMDELESMVVYPRLEITESKPHRIDSIEFSIMPPRMIRERGTVEISRPELYDRDGYPVEGGVMDPRLGVIDPGMKCRVCGGGVGTCNGHQGYIELGRPVIHVRYIKKIHNLLRSTCQKCGRILMEEDEIAELEEKGETIDRIKKSNCPHCEESQEKVKLDRPYTFTLGGDELNPLRIREWFERIPDRDTKVLNIGGGRPEWMIITILPVPSTTVRPSITLESGERSEDDLTHKLVDIVRINQRLRDNITIGAPDFIIEDLHELLQYHVATHFDNGLSGVPPARHRSGRSLRTLTQRLKGKNGRFRNNLSGKRVNFSARTVISPDPNLGINEVGIPRHVAKELTVPVKVNDRNISNLRAKVRRGPDTLNGANYVMRPDGGKKKVTSENGDKIAEELEDGWTVERHLQDGDIVLFNRQPSLHRMSIMAHKVKILDDKTFKLNLCDCPPYNADFDGDEMNLHVPQTEEARAEAEMLMLVQNNIRSPAFGGPIVGCIQDHISGLYLLTREGTELDKETANQLLANIDMEERVEEDVTGKELFSYLLPDDFNLEYESMLHSVEPEADDANVVIENGQLVQGVIDAQGVGDRSGLIIDKIEKHYGAEMAKDFLNRVSKLGLEWLDRRGFTMGIDELDVSSTAKRKITYHTNQAYEKCDDLIEQYEEGTLEELPGMNAEESLENYILKTLGEAQEKVNEAIADDMEENDAKVMVQSGARGSMVNIASLTGLVGSMTLQGERVHRGYQDRTLSHFERGELGPDAHGFVSSALRDGLDPFEFFFNAMNGREGLMDKSVRTRHSGYMERRLVNALQDLRIEYDGTVRDDRKRIVQFVPAEDGIDPAKSERGSIDVEEAVEEALGGG